MKKTKIKDKNKKKKTHKKNKAETRERECFIKETGNQNPRELEGASSFSDLPSKRECDESSAALVPQTLRSILCE